MDRRCLATLLIGLWPSSCAYDWTIGEPASGGAGGSTSTGEGGETGATVTATTTTITSTTPDGCAALLADLAAKKSAAKACPTQGQFCEDLVEKDECGCAVSAVWDLSSEETAAYVSAIEAAAVAGCEPSCSACKGGTPFCSPLSGDLSCYP